MRLIFGNELPYVSHGNTSLKVNTTSGYVIRFLLKHCLNSEVIHTHEVDLQDNLQSMQPISPTFSLQKTVKKLSSRVFIIFPSSDVILIQIIHSINHHCSSPCCTYFEISDMIAHSLPSAITF